MWFFDTLLFDPRSTTLDPANLYTTYVILYTFLFDPRSTTLKTILLTFTPPMWFFDTFLFDPRSTPLKAILLTFTPPMWFFDTFLFDPRSTTLKAILLTFTHRRKKISSSVPSQDSEPSWICVGIINFIPVHDFSLILWNCPDSVVCLVFHFMRYSSQYSHVLRAQLLTQKLLKQFYIPPWLKSSLQTSTVDITIKLTATKYPYLTWQSIFTFYEDIFFLLSVPRLLQDLTVYMSNTVGVLSEAGTTYPLRAYAFTPVCWWGPGRSSC
jgi:hypothetical protein